MRHKRRGMTMIEVLIALAILASACLAVMGMYPAMASLNGNTMDSTEKMYVVQNQLDALVSANAFISTSYVQATPNPFGANGYLRWKGVADPYGDAKVQVIEVDAGWVHEGHVRSMTLYGMVCP
jgi:prepilin-type N-terminal cleavage/methylation domain-containing protein